VTEHEAQGDRDRDDDPDPGETAGRRHPAARTEAGDTSNR
jgi:hypothetical protein